MAQSVRIREFHMPGRRCCCLMRCQPSGVCTLPQVREVEDLMANTAAWRALPPAERAEKEKHYHQNSASLLLLTMREFLVDLPGDWRQQLSIPVTIVLRMRRLTVYCTLIICYLPQRTICGLTRTWRACMCGVMWPMQHTAHCALVLY